MNLGKKTKIVCTIGPATESQEKLTGLVNAGMNVARLNFSHSDHAQQQKRFEKIRKMMHETAKIVAILQDLGGPKIRIGTFRDKVITLIAGQDFTLTTDPAEGTPEKVHVNYPNLPKEVKVGSPILLQDGTRRLEVTAIKGNDIITKVIVGGQLSDHRGVNVPGVELSVSSLTDKDREDVKFGIKNRVDFVALSFVRKADDVRQLRAVLDAAGSKAHIIAKIETPEAVANIDDILSVSDGIMIARGDLAIEIPGENVPVTQKHIIRKCNEAGKPVITATQMLESMMKNPVPTRAEVSDIANAIIDGTDAIMLSEETALGDFPVEAVQEMTKIALKIESEVYTRDIISEHSQSRGVTDVVSQSAVRVAHNVGAKLIIALTRSGKTARMIARHRPVEPILALSDASENAHKLLLSFGCYPMVVPTFKSVEEILKIARAATLDNELVKNGDKVVIVAGLPFGASSETNFILVETL